MQSLYSPRPPCADRKRRLLRRSESARVPATSFHANFLPNGFDAVGGRFTLAFTGVGVLDALSLVDGRLALDEAFR